MLSFLLYRETFNCWDGTEKLHCGDSEAVRTLEGVSSVVSKSLFGFTMAFVCAEEYNCTPSTGLYIKIIYEFIRSINKICA